MRIAETVTFGGSGLDRARGLRRDADGAGRSAERGAPCCPCGAASRCWMASDLAWLPAGHPVLAQARGPPVFLGLDDGDRRALPPTCRTGRPRLGPMRSQAGFFDPTVQQPSGAGTDGEGFAELRGVMTASDPA